MSFTLFLIKYNYIKNELVLALSRFFDFAKSFFKKIKIFLKKSYVAVEIIYYIIRYYIRQIINKIASNFEDKTVLLEFKSFFFVILFSFFFYYFIVIELSILIFGYSLLCYRFLFILIVCFLLASWWLEVELLREKLYEISPTAMENWVNFYKNETPLTFYDFLTDYNNWPLFKTIIVENNWADINDGRVIYKTFFLFMMFLYIYSSGYRFDPRFVNFVAKYFLPVVNFFQSRANPRLEDFSSALIWFRNRIFNYLEYSYETHSTMHDVLKELTLASPRLEDRAHSQWGYKTSLWKSVWFNDIYFLRAVFPNSHLWTMVFEGDQPIISASRFDPNWKLLFVWYVAQEFGNTKFNFWKWHFTNNSLFWDLITDYKKEINRLTNSTNDYVKNNYTWENYFATTTFEHLLAKNYFNKDFFDSRPLFETHGTNMDYYHNIIENYKIEKAWNTEILNEIFTSTAYVNFPYTISGLWDYHKKNKSKSKLNSIFNDKFYNQGLDIGINSFKSLNYEELISSLYSDLDISLYNFYTIENFDNISPSLMKIVFSRPIFSHQLEKLYYSYNYRLNALENAMGVREFYFGKKFDEDFNLNYIINLSNKRLNWIRNIVNKEGFISFLGNQIVTYQDVAYYSRKFFKLSNFIERKSIKDAFREHDIIKHSTQAVEQPKVKKKPILVKISKPEVDNFIAMEAELRSFETLFNLRSDNKKIDPSYVDNNLIFPKTEIPFYIKTLKFFGIGDYKFVMPGFVRYYCPTPYPSAFSTFGKIWNKYQFHQKNKNFTIVGYSDSLAEIWNSTPIALYSGVEAILYFKPLLDLFDYFIWLFVRFINFIIEKMITQEIITPITSIASLAFFVHLIWFIHFYIYTFIFAYLVYYFYVYYFWKIGFLWFYERLYQENFLMSNTDWSFWHSVTELWYNYRTPEQLLLLALQTNLLLHYSFFNYNNYFFVKKNNIYSIINIIFMFLPKENKFIDFVNFQKNFDFSKTKSILKNEYNIFSSFYITSIWKYQLLLFQGGSDVSIDHLVWNYYDYLNQINLFFSWSLWRNYYFVNSNKQFLSLIKQFTILLSSQATTNNFLYLASPILDSVLTWKIFINLFNFLKYYFKNSFSNLKKNFLFVNPNNSLALNYAMFINYKVDFYNFFINSGLDIYSIIKTKEFNFLTKLNTTTFWDDTRYWLLAFFRSFRFIPKIWFPFLNLDLPYEDTRLHLARLAYANSWIGQSMIVRPHFNIIQHLWWTSKLYSRSFTLVNSNTNLNEPGISVLDDVRNFLEKRYSYKYTSKTETIFGITTSLNLNSTFEHRIYGEIPFENKNFDLSFTDNLISKKTTSRAYLKTNPPINLYELGLTPGLLISFFKNYPINLLKTYLTFFTQLDIVTKHFDKKFRNLNEEFLKEDKFDILENLDVYKKEEIYSKYEFYFKQFDYLFWYDENKIESNFIFTFDISFFLNHFTTWDYFSTDHSSLRSKNFSPNKYLVSSESNNLFLSNLDMIAKATSYEYWIDKPFGILDWSELHPLLWYKNIKLLDTGSFSRSWDDPFLNLDTEHTVTEIGLSVYPKEDKKDLSTAYSEEYIGFREKWFPYNTTLIKNQTSLILVGWVGELVSNTVDSTSLIYSILYASPEYDVNSWNLENNFKYNEFTLNGKKSKFFSFFAKNSYQKQFVSRSFTWLNLMISPSSYRYSFGPKANARFDYWSWKSGFTIDYRNGLYLYRPYLGFRHSFFSRLVPYDNTYGFYKTFRQINDNPLVLDTSTDVIDYFTEKDEMAIFEELSQPDREPEELTKEELDSFLIPYKEVYYCFHHPYFVGYLFFWMLIFTAKPFYLGLSNFSFKRLLLREFLLKSTYSDDINFNALSTTWNKIENRFRKNMFKYRIYYSNPSNLTNLLDCIIDDDVLSPMGDINTMHKFFLFNMFSFRFLNLFRGYTNSDIRFLLDYKWIYNYSFSINWLTLDFPFVTNPYLVTSNCANMNLEFILEIFKKQSFTFSHRNSLWEAYNFNLFFDWSSGTYLDLFNLSSYIGSVRSGMSLPDIFFSNPTFVAASFIKYPNDESRNFATDFWFWQTNFVSSEILISNDLALHNLSLLNFFQESLMFVFNFNTKFFEKKKSFFFLDFYIKSPFLDDIDSLRSYNAFDVESKILKAYDSNFFKIWTLMFLYWIQKNLSHELLTLLLDNGLYFSNKKHMNLYFRSLRFWIFSKYSQAQFFYKKIGLFISNFFFKKN